MRIKEGYKVREMAGENVVVARSRGAVDMTNIITLNDSALLLWNALADREFEAEDAARILLDNYSVEALTAERDARAWVNRMIECDLVESK